MLLLEPARGHHRSLTRSCSPEEEEEEAKASTASVIRSTRPNRSRSRAASRARTVNACGTDRLLAEESRRRWPEGSSVTLETVTVTVTVRNARR